MMSGDAIYYSDLQNPNYIPTLGAETKQPPLADVEMNGAAQSYYNFLAHDHIPTTAMQSQEQANNITQKLLEGVSQAYYEFLEHGHLPNRVDKVQPKDTLTALMVTATQDYYNLDAASAQELASNPSEYYDFLRHDYIPTQQNSHDNPTCRTPLADVEMNGAAQSYYNFLAHDHIPTAAMQSQEQANNITQKLLEGVSQAYYEFLEHGHLPNRVDKVQPKDTLTALMVTATQDYYNLDAASAQELASNPSEYYDFLRHDYIPNPRNSRNDAPLLSQPTNALIEKGPDLADIALITNLITPWQDEPARDVSNIQSDLDQISCRNNASEQYTSEIAIAIATICALAWGTRRLLTKSAGTTSVETDAPDSFRQNVVDTDTQRNQEEAQR